jgi:hypothetical protein
MNTPVPYITGDLGWDRQHGEDLGHEEGGPGDHHQGPYGYRYRYDTDSPIPIV